jgi:hypothetical protein
MSEQRSEPRFMVGQVVRATKPAYLGTRQAVGIGDEGVVIARQPDQPGLGFQCYRVRFDNGHVFNRAEFEIEAVVHEEPVCSKCGGVLSTSEDGRCTFCLACRGGIGEPDQPPDDTGISYYNEIGRFPCVLVPVAADRLALTDKHQQLALALADRERLAAEVERLNALLARQAISWQQEIDDALAKARRWKVRVDELEAVNWQLVAAEEQERRHTAESERDALAAQVAAAREAINVALDEGTPYEWHSYVQDALAALDEPEADG